MWFGVDLEQYFQLWMHPVAVLLQKNVVRLVFLLFSVIL